MKHAGKCHDIRLPYIMSLLVLSVPNLKALSGDYLAGNNLEMAFKANDNGFF